MEESWVIEGDHYSQFGPLFPRNGCGPAVNTTTGNIYFSGRNFTVPYLADLVGNNGGFSTFNGVMRGLRLIGIPNAYQPEATIDWLIYMVVRGYPIIVLVDYASFSYRPYGYTLAHFMLMVGYQPGFILCHDPLRAEGPSRFPRQEFVNAINTPSRYPLKDGGYGYNFTNQAVYPLRPVTKLHRLMRQFRKNIEKMSYAYQ